jgi:2-polyprenyl-3-methyl-5-hydroxy-6-metoxy-1,4-benzoquinol methylase
MIRSRLSKAKSSLLIRLDERRRVARHKRFAARAPLPGVIRHRDYISETIPEGGGVENFDTREAELLNSARMEHLDGLGLGLAGKRVLDVGCGVGHLSHYLKSRGCEVVSVDGRAENIEALREKYPDLEQAFVADVESSKLSDPGEFDVVLAYGLLYHLENPIRALRNMASSCKDMLLIETMVCDSDLPLMLLDDETKTYSQALRGLGSRPSPSFVAHALNRIGFEHIYTPRSVPDHRDFRIEWKNSLKWRMDHPFRAIFIASREPITNRELFDLVHRWP